MLRNGRLVEQGTHEALLQKDGYYTELRNAQAQLYQTQKTATRQEEV